MPERAEFGPFQLERETGRLIKHGVPIKLVGHPITVLAALLERPGELVTREELRRRLWGDETFVDYEHGLNAAVNKLRLALRDTAEKPRYVETIPRRGYRFVAPVTTVPAPSPPTTEPIASARPQPSTGKAAVTARPRPPGLAAYVAAAAVALVLVALAGTHLARSRAASPHATGRALLLVLPFENLSGDRDQDFFGEGLAEEAMLLLGQLDPERLSIVARTSAQYVRKAGWRIRRVADELGVDYVVDGSVRRVNGQVRVTAQLTRAADEAQVWARSWDRDVGDLLGIQQELARALTDGVRAQLPGVGAGRQRPERSPVPEAYEAYLRGRYLLGRRTSDALEKAHASLARAIRLDPAYAPAYAALAGAHLQSAYRHVPPAAAIREALAAARRGLALDPELAEAHAALALVFSTYAWDWDEAEREFQRALALNPASADTRIAYAAYLSHMRRFDEAIRQATRALALDPVSLAARTQLSVILYRARRYDDALVELRATEELDPFYPVIYLNRGLVYAAQGRLEEAIAALETGQRLDPASEDFSALLAYARARKGEPDRARAILRELEARSASSFLQPTTVGLVHLALGDRDAALDWLERGYTERSWLTALINVNPEFDPLRDDPRFEALRKSMQFPD